MVESKRDYLLGKEKVGKALMQLSLPATIGMLFGGLYNIVSTIFIGQIGGKDGITALGIAFPLQMLMLAFGSLIGVGAISLISRSLGNGEQETAAKTAGNAILASLLSGLFIIVLVLPFFEPIVRLFGANNDNLVKLTKDFLLPIIIGSPVMIYALVGGNILIGEGQAVYSMQIIGICFLLNIVFNIVFVVLIPLNVTGAGLAAILPYIAGGLYLILLFKKKSTLNLKKEAFKFDLSIQKETVSVGTGAFIRQAGLSIIIIIVNQLLNQYGTDLHIAGYGIIIKINLFLLMPLLGLTQGFQPLIGFSFGAKNPERLKEIIKITMITGTIINVLLFLLVMLLPGQIFQIFTKDRDLINAGIPLMRVIFLVFPLIQVQLIASTYFQAVGKAGAAFFVGLSRQFIFFVPIIMLSAFLFKFNGIYLSFPVADLLAVVFSLIWFLFDVKNIEKRLAAATVAVAR